MSIHNTSRELPRDPVGNRLGRIVLHPRRGIPAPTTHQTATKKAETEKLGEQIDWEAHLGSCVARLIARDIAGQSIVHLKATKLTVERARKFTVTIEAEYVEPS